MSRRGHNRPAGSPALPGAGRKPTSATIKNGDGVFISHVLPDGTADLGRGRARVERADSGGRIIVISQDDGSEIRLVIV